MIDKVDDHYDIIIVGAGIAGSALASALGGSDFRVAVIEAQPLAADMPETNCATVDDYDPRVSALTVASQKFLQGLSVWDTICALRVQPYLHMHVWDADGTASIDFDAAEINQPALGHIVENRITTAALVARLKTFSNTHLLNPAKIAGLQYSPPVARNAVFHEYNQPAEAVAVLSLEDGRRFSSDLLVAADGANSFIRAQAGFEMREWDYEHSAIAFTVQTTAPHQRTAWQRFLPEGPLAFLPLADSGDSQRFCSIVWSAEPDYAEQLLALEDDEFCRQLASAFENRLGNIAAVSRRFAFPLRQRHAVDYVKPGLALIGDAAHTIHPLAGQGINLGLQDVRVLSEELLGAAQRGLDVGEFTTLQRYQRRRKAKNLAMMASMEGFKQLFAQRALPIRWARSAGMRALDGMGPIKHRIMRDAMGL